MNRILTNITEGRGKEGDIELLEELCESTRGASLCALGRSAANPVLSTLRYFRHEYEAHIINKRCPAFSCKHLVSYYIDPESCEACMICFRKCTSGAISGGKDKIHIIDQAKCNRCGTCFEVCPTRFGAAMRLTGEPAPGAIPEEARILIRTTKSEKASKAR